MGAELTDTLAQDDPEKATITQQRDGDLLVLDGALVVWTLPQLPTEVAPRISVAGLDKMTPPAPGIWPRRSAPALSWRG